MPMSEGIETHDRFPRIGGAEVYSYHYERAHGRFLILAFKGDAVHPWVVAHVRELTDAEWENGHYRAEYSDAATLFRKKVMF